MSPNDPNRPMSVHARVVALVVALAAGFAPVAAPAQTAGGAPPTAIPAQPASAATIAAIRAQLTGLDFGDRTDFDEAARGFVGTVPDAHVTLADGSPAWTMRRHRFLEAGGEPPPSVHPSLWRQATLNQKHGLFKVTDRVWQVRGLDTANLTFVEGDTGLIVIDAGTVAETARAALALYTEHRGAKPVRAVIYSHSHVDHFGGVRGLVDENEVKAGRVQIVAPVGFMEHAVSENLIAGNAMSRRAQYQFGVLLAPGERGQVDTGLSRTASRGTVTLIPPTTLIEKAVETRTIDGVTIEFMLTPHAEAPAEMVMFLPQFEVLDAAEIVNHTMHNLYTLRGTEVRDALAWSKYVEQVRRRYAPRATVMISQHTWPFFGRERLDRALQVHHDLYKFIHDQTLRLANLGWKPREIARALQLPEGIAREWSARGYYGTLAHNSRAVYQKYLGWYDANPTHLNPLPEADSARRTIAYMGGADAVLAKAREDFGRGDYQWVVEVLNHLVFAQPDHREARELAARAHEQLAYQSESGVWRNVYLTAAQELRTGAPRGPLGATGSADVVRALSVEQYFDYLAVRLDPARAGNRAMTIHWTFTDSGQTVLLTLRNGVLSHVSGVPDPRADATIALPRAVLDDITLRRKSFPQAVQAGEAKVGGDVQALGALMGMLDEFRPNFDIVTPPMPAAAAR